MQLVDSKSHTASIAMFGVERRRLALGSADIRVGSEHYQIEAGRAHGRRRADGGLVSRLKGASASERVLVLLLAAFVVTASPALLATVRSAVSLALQILLQAGHFGLLAFQIFGR